MIHAGSNGYAAGCSRCGATTVWHGSTIPPSAGWHPPKGLRRRVAQREEMAHATARLFISGSPAEVVDQLGPIVEAGAGGFAFRIRFDGVGGPELERCIEQLANEVVPQLQRMAP